MNECKQDAKALIICCPMYRRKRVNEDISQDRKEFTIGGGDKT